NGNADASHRVAAPVRGIGVAVLVGRRDEEGVGAGDQVGVAVLEPAGADGGGRAARHPARLPFLNVFGAVGVHLVEIHADTGAGRGGAAVHPHTATAARLDGDHPHVYGAFGLREQG